MCPSPQPSRSDDNNEEQSPDRNRDRRRGRRRSDANLGLIVSGLMQRVVAMQIWQRAVRVVNEIRRPNMNQASAENRMIINPENPEQNAIPIDPESPINLELPDENLMPINRGVPEIVIEPPNPADEPPASPINPENPGSINLLLTAEECDEFRMVWSESEPQPQATTTMRRIIVGTRRVEAMMRMYWLRDLVKNDRPVVTNLVYTNEQNTVNRITFERRSRMLAYTRWRMLRASLMYNRDVFLERLRQGRQNEQNLSAAVVAAASAPTPTPTDEEIQRRKDARAKLQKIIRGVLQMQRVASAFAEGIHHKRRRYRPSKKLKQKPRPMYIEEEDDDDNNSEIFCNCPDAMQPTPSSSSQGSSEGISNRSSSEIPPRYASIPGRPITSQGRPVRPGRPRRASASPSRSSTFPSGSARSESEETTGLRACLSSKANITRPPDLVPFLEFFSSDTHYNAVHSNDARKSTYYNRNLAAPPASFGPSRPSPRCPRCKRRQRLTRFCKVVTSLDLASSSEDTTPTSEDSSKSISDE